MSIVSAFNDIAVAQGGTADTSGTIVGAIDALNDALAGSDQDRAKTIEGAIELLGENIGGGSIKYQISIADDDFPEGTSVAIYEFNPTDPGEPTEYGGECTVGYIYIVDITVPAGYFCSEIYVGFEDAALSEFNIAYLNGHQAMFAMPNRDDVVISADISEQQ